MDLTCILKWHRLSNAAKIPTKRDEDAGFDIYTIEEDVEIPPHGQHLFSTGLQVAPSKGWWLAVWDRGSTGSIGEHIHCGVVDNGYRNELFICIKNDNPYPVKFTNKEEKGLHTHKEWVNIPSNSEIAPGVFTLEYLQEEKDVIDYLVYPTSKAICQVIPILQPQCLSYEVSDAEWAMLTPTQRGEGKLGSSGK